MPNMIEPELILSTSNGPYRVGGRCGVPTRKRSMTRWSGRWEMSAMWAMRRSAESRVRESSEGGRIGPDLDLAPPFIAPLRGKQRRLPLAAVPRHVALGPRLPPRSPRPLRVAFAGRSSAGAEPEPTRGARSATHAPIRDFSRWFFPFTPRFSAIFCLHPLSLCFFLR